MAPGAGAGVGRRGPGDLVGVRRMAARALELSAVLAGVGSACVPEVERLPVRIAVAAGAIDPGAHVVRRHADCSDVVVAAGTARCERAVIDFRRNPGECSMAAVALLRRWDMRAWHADGTH